MVLLFSLAFFYAADAYAVEPTLAVKAVVGTGLQQVSQAWSLADLAKLKVARTERGVPGVLFSEFIKEVLAPLAVQDRARVDLVVVNNIQGQKTPIPRSMVQKYPVLLTGARDVGFSSVLQGAGVAKKMAEELVPFDRYSVNQIVSIELTSFQAFYGDALFLKRRTDPSLLRGEKRFLQNCLTCHHGETGYQELARRYGASREKFAEQHMSAPTVQQLSRGEHEAVAKYLRAITLQNHQVAESSSSL